MAEEHMADHEASAGSASSTAGSYGYVSLVGLQPRDPILVVQKIKKGLSYSAFSHFQKATGLSTADLADVVVIKIRTLHRRKEQGRFEPDESDRIVRASRVVGKARELFEGDMEAATHWLATPQRALRGERPLDLASTDVGVREVEALIERLEHGVLT